MNNASTFDRLVLCGLALFIVTTFLASCLASAATTVVARTVKTTTNAASAVARFTMAGVRVASDTAARSVRGNQEEGVS